MIDLNGATLWDVLGFGKKPRGKKAIGGAIDAAPARRKEPTTPGAGERANERAKGPAPRVGLGEAMPERGRADPEAVLPKSMAERYLLMEREMLARHGLRVRKWRTNMSGVAWQVTYRDGTVSRLIESPRPRGPVSAGIFLHEVGHHAIGFNRYKPRCLEEYHAWMYSLDQMERWGLNVTQPVRDRVHDSLHYAVAKAARRGLKSVPAELVPFVAPRER